MSARNDRRFFKKRARKEAPEVLPALAKLKRDADEQRGEIVQCIVAGWSFCLSLAQFDDVRRTKPKEFLDAMRAMLRMPELDYVDICDGKCGETHEHYHFSARVNPHTRGSVPEDWENLGRAVAALEIPAQVAEAASKQIEDDEWVSHWAVHYPWTVPLN